MAIVYSVSTNKGGVGKTSLVTNMAAAIIQTQKKAKVLIVDTDAQGNSAMAFGKTPIDYEHTIYDVLVKGMSIEQVRVKLMDRLDFVPANKEMNFFVFDVLLNPKDYPQPLYLLKPAIDAVRDQYDYIFIDTPPSLEVVAGNVLLTADRVIIPFVPETFAVSGIENVIDVINDFKAEQNPSIVIDGMVGMLVDMRTVLHSEMMVQARKYCAEHGYHLYDTVIPRSVRFAAATAYDGKPAVLADQNNPLVATYFDLLKEVLKRGKKTLVN
ncbi:ParA family protein [Paenibacillus sp. 1P07SE]|uniref:ParA family protein n=1 Tax=Paenibacillus sp. 1P07SE TaxID=3132209 RepID=UPI0039A45DB0